MGSQEVLVTSGQRWMVLATTLTLVQEVIKLLLLLVHLELHCLQDLRLHGIHLFHHRQLWRRRWRVLIVLLRATWVLAAASVNHLQHWTHN